MVNSNRKKYKNFFNRDDHNGAEFQVEKKDRKFQKNGDSIKFSEI